VAPHDVPITVSPANAVPLGKETTDGIAVRTAGTNWFSSCPRSRRPAGKGKSGIPATAAGISVRSPGCAEPEGGVRGRPDGPKRQPDPPAAAPSTR